MVRQSKRASIALLLLVVCAPLAMGGAMAADADTGTTPAAEATTPAAEATTPAAEATTSAAESTVTPLGHFSERSSIRAGNNSTLKTGASNETGAVTASATGTIKTSYTVNRTPNDIGRVTVEYSVIVPDSVVTVYVYLNSSLSAPLGVGSSSNAGYDATRGAWEISSPRGSTTVANITYTIETNTTSTFGGFNTVETNNWAFVGSAQVNAYHQWSYYGSEPAFEQSYAASGQGYAAPGRVFLGSYSRYQGSSNSQVFTLVYPDATTSQVNPTQALNALTSASNTLAIGDADAETTLFVLPDPIRGGGRAGSESGWVHESSSLDVGSVWLHEYTHTRQAWIDNDFDLQAGSDVEWLTEAMGDFYGAYLPLQTGTTDVQSFRDHIATTQYENKVLQDADTQSTELKNYYKGRRVLGALDIRIRKHTNGQKTLNDVITHINGLSGTFTYSDFRSEVVDLTNASTGNWLDTYVQTTAAPTIPQDISPYYGANGAPTADAGSNQTVDEGASVQLDASGSSDPDGDSLSYSWTQTGGPSVSLSDQSSATPSFTAPSVSSQTTLTFEVTVSDGTTTDTDTVSITVRAANDPPTADAGSNQTVDAGASVTLDASGSSDPDGDSLSYAWSQQSGTTVTLFSSSTATPTFTAPDVSSTTTLTFLVNVSDGNGGSDTDTVSVTVEPTNDPPTADTGSNQTVDENASVQLDASGSSDPDGDSLDYAWTQTGGPSVTLSNQSSATPTFTAPTVTANTTLTFVVNVSDGNGGSDTDTVSVLVRATNDPPTADAGSNQTVDEGASVQLDASSSSDPNGDSLSYAWTQTGGPSVTLSNQSSATPTFTAPNVTANTTLTFVVNVSDGIASDTDTVSVTVSDTTSQNQPPTADAGSNRTVDEGASVALNASGSSDPNGDSLSYAWTQTGGPSVTLSNTTAATLSFTAPNVTSNTTLTFVVNVSDGTGGSDTDTVSVLVTPADNGTEQNQPPRADAGPDKTVDESTTVILNGTGSSDPDGDLLGYNWTQTNGPSVALGNGSAALTPFTAPNVSANTTLTFTLTVNDGSASDTDTVTITVINTTDTEQNQSPTADAGPDQTVDENATVALDATGSSDPEGDDLTYAWAQVGGPTVTLANATTATPTFTAPSVTGNATLTFRVTVTDTAGNVATDEVTITVRDTGDASGNRAPRADAGSDATADANTVVRLDASGSSDPDGDSLRYSWTQTGGTSVILAANGTAKPTFLAPNVTTTTTLTFQVTVSDGNASDTDTVTVTVTPSNNTSSLPRATRTVPSNVSPGENVTVTLDAVAGGSGITIQESFAPPFASVTITSVTVNGSTVNPFLSVTRPAGIVVTVNGVSSGANVSVEYTVSIPENATANTTYLLAGTVTSGQQATLQSNQLTVGQGSPLGGLPGQYDSDTDGRISIRELGMAASDFAQGKLGISGLGRIAAVFASG